MLEPVVARTCLALSIARSRRRRRCRCCLRRCLGVICGGLWIASQVCARGVNRDGMTREIRVRETEQNHSSIPVLALVPCFPLPARLFKCLRRPCGIQIRVFFFPFYSSLGTVVKNSGCNIHVVQKGRRAVSARKLMQDSKQASKRMKEIGRAVYFAANHI